MRLFGEKVDRKVIYQRRVGAYGIIVHNNELLLTEQITSENNIDVQVLINNVGIGSTDSFEDTTLDFDIV